MQNITNQPSTIISNGMLRPSADKKTQSSEQVVRFEEILNNVTASKTEIPYVQSAKAKELREWVMEDSTKDPERAAMWAHTFGNGPIDGPLIDCTNFLAVRLSATGELYTQKMQTYYDQVRQENQGELSNLYISEKAIGTADVDILKKVFSYYDSLPNEFKRIGDF